MRVRRRAVRRGWWSLRRVSVDLGSLRCLPWQEHRLDQLAFAADGHACESLEPEAVGNIRLPIEPHRERVKVGGRDLPRLHAIDKVLEQGRRQAVAPNPGHGQIP